MSNRPKWFSSVVAVLVFTVLLSSILIAKLNAQDLFGPASASPQKGKGDAEMTKELVDDLFPIVSGQEYVIGSDSSNLISGTTYPLTPLTGVSLEDMSTGTTQLVAASQDDTASAVTNIGFDFWYDGVRFTQFSCNANGLCRLGSTVVTTEFNNTSASAGFNTTTNAPKIAPYFEDLCTGTNGKVHFKVIGSAPSRKLVVEWQNMQVTRGTACAGAGAGTLQLWITESAAASNPGAIQFVYGSGIVASNAADGGSSIGLQSGAATNFASVTASADTVSYTVHDGLNAAGIASGKSYRFNPNSPDGPPTNLNFSMVTATTQQLDWTDNSSNELGFVLYRSTDGTNFTFLGTTGAGVTTFGDSALLPSTNYFYRVYGFTEGALSAVLPGSNSTGVPGNDTCNGAGGNWSSTTTWTDGTVPTAGDHVTIGSGCTVTVDVANAAAINLTIDSGGTLQSPLAGAVTTNNLTVSGNVTNNGTLDFSTNGDTSGAILTFGAGSSNVSFSGTGATTDVRTIAVNKGVQATTVELSTTNFTVRGVNTDVAGYLTLTSGTFKISGTFTIANRTFTTATYTIPLIGGIWLNNPNYTVASTASAAATSNNGLLRVTQGTYNIGVGAADQMRGGAGAVFNFEGGTINVSGAFDPQSAVTYNQSGGTLNVGVVGNTVSNFGTFELFAAASTFIMSGGTINVVNPSTGATKVDYRNATATATTNITGGLVVIGATGAPASSIYNVSGQMPSTTINATQTMRVNNAAVFMRGTTVNNNGTIDSTGANARYDFGSVTGAMTYNGPGAIGSLATPFAGIGVSANSTFQTTLNAPVFVNRINLFQGGFVNSGQITLGNAGTSTTVVQIGSTGLTTPGGSFDVTPVHNQGSGGQILLYAFETAPRTTGVEINPTRILASINLIDNPNGVTIAGGDLNLTATAAALVLTNGRLITGSNTLTLNSGTATVTRTSGYVDGNFRKTYAAAANKTFEVGTANGYSPVAINVTAGTFPAQVTAKAVQSAHPAMPTPAKALQRYWTLTGTGLTADLTFNYLDPADIPGTATEANFVIMKHDGSFSQPGGTVNTAANSATITGVTSLSDWTLAEPSALTAPGVLALSNSTYSVGESGGSLTVTVNRTGGSDGAVSADYSLSGGTATGGAACAGNIDYDNDGGTVNFANGETSKTFNIPICPDGVYEGNETFNATLSNPTGGATIGAPSSATVTITDDETVPTVQFSSATYSTTEPLAGLGSGATISVTLSGPSQATVSVNFATSNGTATGGALPCDGTDDYISTSGTLNFTGGSTNQGFVVETCLDSVDEADETVNLTLSSPSGATLGTPNPAVLTILDNDGPAGGPITVTATAGTTGPTNYTTLKEAIDAINAGTHQGDITVAVVANTTETATSVLNAGTGAAPAAYTSVLIRPVTDGVTIAGPSVQGRGLIELNGADNVTIDGDNPNTGGTNRNLTIQNTAANTVTFTSVLRIALAATVINTADNNTFKNLNLLGSATGRNTGTATTTTGTENNSFVIFAGPGASTASTTTAPAAVASVSTGVGAGATATNLIISNNGVTTGARGISINGSAATVFPGLQITGNTVGNATAGNADQVTAVGITASGSADGLIARNTVWVEGFVGSSAAGHGIAVGVNSAVGTYTIEENKVNRVQNNNPATWSAFGINLGGSTNHVVRNNFVSGVINNQVAGTGAFSLTFGAFGIRIAAGTGHKIYHNSVNMYGALPGTVSTDLTAAFGMSATTQTGVDVRNNIFSNQITGGNPAGTRNVAVALPTGGTATMNLTWNNNAYYVGTDALNRLAQVGVTFGTGEYQVGDFDPTATTPATNFRAYTSALSAAGTNDNASFAAPLPGPFTSNVDLHIPAGTATRLESGGAAVGVTTDIDTEARNATTPDIGADEFAGSPAPANDIGAIAFVVPANGGTIPTGSLTPQARFTNAGTATQTNVTVRFKIIDSSMVTIYNQTATIPSIAPLQNLVVSFPSTPISTPGTYTMQAISELAGDTNPANDMISGSFNAVAAINGTITVGSGGDYTSLTNAGGVFQALNLAGISGNVTVNITSDLTAETGAVMLNQIAESGVGGYTVTFKPSGAARVISGSSASNAGLITLNGADRIVFDGSLSGGTDRSLTITNNQLTTTTVFWIRSQNASNGSNNNTIKNCIINGAPGPNSTTTAGVLTGSGVTLGNDAEAPNSNNTLQNNWIYRVQNSAYLRGGLTAPVFDQNWTVVGNEFGSTNANDKNIFRGMLIGNSANFTISGNTVHGIQSTTTTTAAMSGIQLGLLLSNGTVTNNQISDIKNVSATGAGAHGISIIATSTGSNVTIANNFVSDIAANGSATVASNGHGIAFLSASAGSGFNVYFNSVSLSTNQATAQTSAGLFIIGTFNGAGAINLRNNILSNTESTGTRYAVYSLAPATVFSTIDYNDYFAQNVGFIGGSARATLPDWQAATTQDANSKSVDPLFVSATNLHLQPTSTLLGMAVAGTGITTDIDGQTRDTPPDIGADEILAGATPGSVQFSSASTSVSEAGGFVTLTVTRTGGTGGAISVNYATANGTATGGASCAAGIDFVNANGTLNWADGDGGSKTFSVVICNDATFEANETFTAGLSGATGGATIGTPSSETVTINNDDPPPSGVFSISDVRVTEGNVGAVNATFTVTFVGSGAASIQYATANGTAVAGTDYLAASGTLNFNSLSENGLPPTSSQTVTVVVISDVAKEANETFFVNLSSPTGGSIADGTGVGIIVDEDRAYVSDFDRDLRSDVSVYRPSEGIWYVLQTASQTPKIVVFGLPTDKAVPGDYDGDGETDYALYRPSTGEWYRLFSSNGLKAVTQWGTTGDIPVQGDYDGDGKVDLSIFRPSTGAWWVLQSSDGQSNVQTFGLSGDIPVMGDFDGDAKTDRTVFRNGVWYSRRSSDGGVSIVNWGLAGDIPLGGDFDGDGSYDLAIYRNGAWWIRESLTGTVRIVNLGLSTDIPVPADYDGDGTTDLGIFRPSTGDWHLLRSSGGGVFGPHWGQTGDVPLPAAYQAQP